MHFRTLIGLGFVGLALGGFDGGAPSPIGARLGAPTSGDVNSTLHRSLPAESRAPAAPLGITIPHFKHTDFPFVTTVQDDGTGKAGGYQVAKVNLEFIRILLPFTVITWYCPFNIAMPLRTEMMGKISPRLAASMSVVVTNSVGAGMDYKLPQGIFCHRFIGGVRATFTSMYPFLGSSVIQ